MSADAHVESDEIVTEVDDQQTDGADGTDETGGTDGADGTEGESGDAPSNRTNLLEQEGDIAADYLEELLDIADLDGDLDMDVEGERAVVAIVGRGLGNLVGDKGETLEALQELTRLAVQQSTGARNRLMLDIAGWRSQRREELSELGRQAANEVKDSGESQRMRPMTPFERKIVHDAVASVRGVRSESEGEEPRRRVVVLPAG